MRLSKVVLCAWVVAISSGCAGGDTTEGTDPSEASVCTVVRAGGGWWNQPIAEQTGMFHVELDATPAAANIDAVVGVADGSATTFTRLAAIVRFNASGTIDVRAGDTYRADSSYTYTPGSTYHVRLDIDLQAHTYSVWLAFGAGSHLYVPIARDYPFRTEQAAVTRLDTVASEVDASSGAIELCDVAAVSDHTTADGCTAVSAGDGFVAQATADGSSVVHAQLTARPAADGIDAVIALAAGAPAAFNDLAVAVRFAPSGMIDVRDGDGYRADSAFAYHAGNDYRIDVVADVASHTYSVFARQNSGAQIRLASNVAFRTQQASVTHLDHLATIVDGSAGRISVCNPAVGALNDLAYARNGAYALAPLASGGVVLSTPTFTQVLDTAGRPTAAITDGGEVAADGAGNVFIGQAYTTNITIAAYSPTLVFRWLRSYNATTVSGIGADSRGHVTFALPAGTATFYVAQLETSDGSVRWSKYLPAGAIGFGANGFAIGRAGSGSLTIEQYDWDGNLLRSRAFTGTITVDAIAMDAAQGIAFAGTYSGTVSFGGADLPPYSNPEGQTNGYVVKLSPTGSHVFSTRTGMSVIGGVATDTEHTLVSGTERTQLYYPSLATYDSTGSAIGPERSVLASWGFGDRVAVGPTGTVWWNTRPMWVNGMPSEFLLAYPP